MSVIKLAVMSASRYSVSFGPSTLGVKLLVVHSIRMSSYLFNCVRQHCAQITYERCWLLDRLMRVNKEKNNESAFAIGNFRNLMFVDCVFEHEL